MPNAPQGETYDDLPDLLAQREQWKPNRWTWALLAMLVLGIGFAAGAFSAQLAGAGTPSTTAFAFPGGGGGFPSGFPGNGPGFAAGSRTSASGPGTSTTSSNPGTVTGVVKVASKGKLYVTDAQGQTIIIEVPESADVAVAQAASVAEIQPGDSVVVSGAPSDDGSNMTATSVTATTASPAKE